MFYNGQLYFTRITLDAADEGALMNSSSLRPYRGNGEETLIMGKRLLPHYKGSSKGWNLQSQSL